MQSEFRHQLNAKGINITEVCMGNGNIDKASQLEKHLLELKCSIHDETAVDMTGLCLGLYGVLNENNCGDGKLSCMKADVHYPPCNYKFDLR